MAFETTTAKDNIRRQYDLPILRDWSDEHHTQLSYLGLTGPMLYDIEDWKSLLSGEITTVEETRENLSQITAAATGLGFSDTQVILGQIEDVIVNGAGERSTVPRCHSYVKKRCFFDYDLVNLDFDGGIGNTRDRVSAVTSLIQRQSRHGCILLLSVSPRSQQSSDLQYDIANLRRQHTDKSHVKAIEFYSGTQKGFEIFRLKAMVPIVVHDAARTNYLTCDSYAPVTYIGSKGWRMIHFAFRLRPQPDGLRGTTTLSDGDSLLLPLLESVDAGIRLHKKQVPGVRMDLLPAHCPLI